MTALTNRLPQVRLRTIFLFFLCAAVGLTVGTSSKPNSATPLLTVLGWHGAQLNWHFALLSAVSVAVVIGLGHQVAHLWQWKPRDGIAINAANFVRRFGIAWRLAIACLLVTCLVAAMLLSRQIVQFPQSETNSSYEPFPYAILGLCLIVVLSVSLDDWWSRIEHRRESRLRRAALAIVGVVIAVFVILDMGILHFLVHLATHGIEQAQPAKHQTEKFPDLKAEGFRTFWVSVGAAGFLVSAASSMVLVNSRRERRSRFVIGVCAFAVSVLVLIAYCIWYHSFELNRISPYLAEVALRSTFLEWCAGPVLAIILITVGAQRLSQTTPFRFTVESGISKDTDPRWIYENAICLILLVGAVVAYVIALIWTVTNIPSFSRWTVLAEASVVLLREPGGMLMTAICVLSIQLGYVRWRRRNDQVDWTITAIDPRRFLWNWIALAILTCVTIPTISAFVFAFWLGPWYLFGP